MNDSFWTEKIKTAEEHQADAFAILSGSVLTTSSADADYIKKVAAKISETAADPFPTVPVKVAEPAEAEESEESEKCERCGESQTECKCSEKEASAQDDESAELRKVASIISLLERTPEGLEMLKMAQAIGYDAADAFAAEAGGALKKAEALHASSADGMGGVVKSASEASAVAALAEDVGKGFRARDILVPLGLGGAGAAGGYYLSEPEHRNRNALALGALGVLGGGAGAMVGRSGAGTELLEKQLARQFSKDVKPEAIGKLLAEEGDLMSLAKLSKHDVQTAALLERLKANPALARDAELSSHIGSMHELARDGRNAGMTDAEIWKEMMPYHNKYTNALRTLGAMK